MNAILPLPSAAPKTVTLLGCTGSIGQSTLALLRQHAQQFQVTALTANGNVQALIQAAREFKPSLAVIGREELHDELKNGLAGTGIRTLAGAEALNEAAALPSDMVVAAMVGAAGLAPALAAIRRGATIALANKECLVSAGDIIMREIRRNHARIIPIDSEHSALFQVFDFERPETVEKIIITASGGPFRNFTRDEMKQVTPQQAVKHPNWSMGAKISVDSATMMNKGLEVIEAYHLFPVREAQIEIVVHPESIIHGMVSYKDGSVLAQMGEPDMTTPIAYALAWPERLDTPTKRLDLTRLSRLTFEAPDMERFPALQLAREALKTGGTAPCIMNAANEVAVQHFLEGKIGFLQIPDIIEQTLAQIAPTHADSIDEVLAADGEGRRCAAALAQQQKG